MLYVVGYKHYVVQSQLPAKNSQFLFIINLFPNNNIDKNLNLLVLGVH